MIAEKAHANQSYGLFPYMYHIHDVVGVAKEFNLSEFVKIGCALHDSMEDDSVSYNDVKKYFGEYVAEAVYAVTDELGRSRKERKEKTYPKIRENSLAPAIKLCDRIANVRHSREYNRDKFKMYRNEAREFEDAIGRHRLVEDLWIALDKAYLEF